MNIGILGTGSIARTMAAEFAKVPAFRCEAVCSRQQATGEAGSSNCQKLRLVRPGQEDICSEYSESPWFYEVAEIAMILALKDYDACYAALKKTRQVVSVLEAAREDAQLGF